MNSQENYYKYERKEMLPFVPEQCQKVLEVGCGEGSFSSLLKMRGAQEVWGVELDAEAGKIATSRLDKVLIGDIVACLQELPENYFDCIIFNDVLEHIIDPEELLLLINPLIVKNGFIVASIPNVRYIKNLIELIIKKDWEYKDEGILDRTHLRFFTKKSIVRMFDKLPYQLVKIEGVQPLGWKFQLINLLTLFRHSDMRFIQFAVVVQKNHA